MAWIVRSGANFASQICREGPTFSEEPTLIARPAPRHRIGEAIRVDHPRGEPVRVRSFNPTSSADGPTA
jgi:hypothetical protein